MGSEERLEQALRSFQEQAKKASELKEKLSELRGHARNADGSVTVTVAPSGAVLGLQLSPLAMRRSHTQLQQEILATIRQATQQAAATMQATVEPVLGDKMQRFREAFQAQSVTPLGPSAPPPASSLPPPGQQPGQPLGTQPGQQPGRQQAQPPPPQPAQHPGQQPLRSAPRTRRPVEEPDDEDFNGPILR
ncbi:YbaB/EbfC family nucleoid-associated protein [Saccharomonospora cyanea]|uniref:YbaB/EbfC DNA-binding family protein n=1 Tax=Saccharomonospora cyanea NA-134 TaxID=882082 RepID=H5XCB1_9PSEU|nr:YbaB/EbfC family nucleoid-associated protein [Saccharomonospora cyanea]EHR59115.1 hypothetical protein SaccyDRAFT_0175 [Saccharomonospora cyanea NA-134]